MMQFSPTVQRRRRGENIVSMINVVFLLLIFFLMSAQIAPPDPIEVTLPDSTSTQTPTQKDTLYIAKDGGLFFEKSQGAAVWDALAARDATEPLLIRADAALPAAQLAALLPKLANAGVTDTLLLTGGK